MLLTADLFFRRHEKLDIHETLQELDLPIKYFDRLSDFRLDFVSEIRHERLIGRDEAKYFPVSFIDDLPHILFSWDSQIPWPNPKLRTPGKIQVDDGGGGGREDAAAQEG